MPYTEPDATIISTQPPADPIRSMSVGTRENVARMLVALCLVALLIGAGYAVLTKPTLIATKNGVTASLPYHWKYAWIDVPADLKGVVDSGVDIFYDETAYDEGKILDLANQKNGTFLDAPPAGVFVSARLKDSSTIITPKVIAKGQVPNAVMTNLHVFASDSVRGFASQVKGSYTGEAIVSGKKLLTMVFPRDRAIMGGSPMAYIVESFK
jgi:hypothetical protein